MQTSMCPLPSRQSLRLTCSPAPMPHLRNRDHDGIIAPVSDEEIHHVVDAGRCAIRHVQVLRVAGVAIPPLDGIGNQLPHHKGTGTLTAWECMASSDNMQTTWNPGKYRWPMPGRTCRPRRPQGSDPGAASRAQSHLRGRDAPLPAPPAAAGRYMHAGGAVRASHIHMCR